MSTAPVRTYSVEEYLALERQSETKHQYYRGEIFAMTGASLPHNRIVSNLVATIHLSLRGTNCEVLPSDMRLKSPAGLYTYPDAVIVCGGPRLEDSHRDTLLNPTVIFEVLSPSTEAYDRGKKFGFYQQIESLKEYVIVSQDEILVEQYLREENPDRWSLTSMRSPEDELQLSTGDCRLKLSDIYQNVDFDQTKSSPRFPS